MLETSKGKKRPRDPAPLAKFVDVATGEIEDRELPALKRTMT